MKKQINPYKILSILFLLFAAMLFFKGEYDKREINLALGNCRELKGICVDTLNTSLIGWYETMVSCGKYCFNLTEEEINLYINNDSFNSLINQKGGPK